jgi:hypothetical protein
MNVMLIFAGRALLAGCTGILAGLVLDKSLGLPTGSYALGVAWGIFFVTGLLLLLLDPSKFFASRSAQEIRPWIWPSIVGLALSFVILPGCLEWSSSYRGEDEGFNAKTAFTHVPSATSFEFQRPPTLGQQSFECS